MALHGWCSVHDERLQVKAVSLMAPWLTFPRNPGQYVNNMYLRR